LIIAVRFFLSVAFLAVGNNADIFFRKFSNSLNVVTGNFFFFCGFTFFTKLFINWLALIVEGVSSLSITSVDSLIAFCIELVNTSMLLSPALNTASLSTAL